MCCATGAAACDGRGALCSCVLTKRPATLSEPASAPKLSRPRRENRIPENLSDQTPARLTIVIEEIVTYFAAELALAGDLEGIRKEVANLRRGLSRRCARCLCQS